VSTAVTEATPRGPDAHRPPRSVAAGLFDPAQLVRSLPESLRKLDPRHLVRSPVMFVVEVGSVFTTVLAIGDPSAFAFAIAGWLWATVVFANLAEAVAEGRGRAQAATLRRAKTETVARRLLPESTRGSDTGVGGAEERVPGAQLTVGDLVVVEAGEVIPGDGDVIEGVTSTPSRPRPPSSWNSAA
jgi:K+-transporting ATPase ATPase B chain